MKEKLVVIISAAEWDGVFHRPHHFAKRFSKLDHTKVLYVEPPVTLLGPIKDPKKLIGWKKWIKKAVEVEKDLFVLAPPPTLPFGMKKPLVNKMNQQVISAEIFSFIAKNKLKNVELVLYNFLPSAADLIKNFDFIETIYDCVDDHSEFKGLINVDYINALEKSVCEQSDVCFATAQKLLDDKIAWNSNFHLINNGADFEHFYREDKSLVKRPYDLPSNDKPIIGFVGGIGTWIDLEWIRDLSVATLDTHHIVLIGPSSVDLSILLEQGNITYLGKKHYNDLPEYYHHFNFAIMPFKIEKLTESVNPIKMYEYLAAGIPTISTDLQEARRYQDVLSIFNSGTMAAKFINEFVDTDAHRMKREETGKNNSWNARFEAVLSHTKTYSTK